MLTEWYSQETDSYDVTGITVDGKRFKLTTTKWWHANGINLFRGSVWLVRDGKRTLVKRVWN